MPTQQFVGEGVPVRPLIDLHRDSFITLTRQRPTILYLGKNDWAKLQRECDESAFFRFFPPYAGNERPQYAGLYIVFVNEDDWIGIAC